jgi:pimeloyl-ACP methyl ester carboxylesterase
VNVQARSLVRPFENMKIEDVKSLLDNPDCQIQSRLIEGVDGFELRVYSFIPHKDSGACPVAFIPGWTSVMDGWAPLLAEWANTRVIHYIETREKQSAKIRRRIRKEDFEMNRHAEDLRSIVKTLNLGSDVLWFGSSLGATVILHGLREGTLAGTGAFLVAPNSEFRFSTWQIPFIAAPWWCYPPLIRLFGLPYLKWRLKEPKQYIRYRRTLTQAHLPRLKKSVQANRRYALPKDLSSVEIPVAICVAASDTLHTGDDSHSIANSLPKGSVVEVPSNQYAHEGDLIPDVNAWELDSGD